MGTALEIVDMAPLTDRTLPRATGSPSRRARYAARRTGSRLLNLVCGVEDLEVARFMRAGVVEGKANPLPPRTVVPDATYQVLYPSVSVDVAASPRPWDDTYPYPSADGVPLVRPPYGCWSLPGGRWHPRLGVVFGGAHQSMIDGAFRFPLRFTRVLDLSWRDAPVAQVTGVGIGLETDFDDNHYHNLVDLAPRAAALRHPWFRQYDEIALYTYSLRHNPALDHLVRRLLPDNVRVVHVDKNTTIQPDVLLMLDPPMDAWYCVPPAWYLRAVRDVCGSGDGAPTGDPIYISRQGAKKRRIVNEDRLLDELGDRGFRSVRTETLGPGQVIELMGRAPMVVAMTGAGLANTIYCRPGASVVELSAADHWSPELFFIAQAAGLDFRSSIGRDAGCPTSRWRGNKYHQFRHDYYRRRDADLEADVDGVCAIVDECLGRSATGEHEVPAP